MATISRTVADLRATFRPLVPGGPVLVRPANGSFHEVTEPEITEVIDDIERLFLCKDLEEEPSPLEKFALRILSESYFA